MLYKLWTTHEINQSDEERNNSNKKVATELLNVEKLFQKGPSKILAVYLNAPHLALLV